MLIFSRYSLGLLLQNLDPRTIENIMNAVLSGVAATAIKKQELGLQNKHVLYCEG